MIYVYRFSCALDDASHIFYRPHILVPNNTKELEFPFIFDFQLAEGKIIPKQEPALAL